MGEDHLKRLTHKLCIDIKDFIFNVYIFIGQASSLSLGDVFTRIPLIHKNPAEFRPKFNQPLQISHNTRRHLKLTEVQN